MKSNITSAEYCCNWIRMHVIQYYKKRIRLKRLQLLLCSTVIFNISIAQVYRQSLEINCTKIQTVHIKGKLTAHYELYLRNFSADTLQVNALNVLNKNKDTIYTVTDANRLRMIAEKAGFPASENPVKLMPGQSATVFLDYAIAEKIDSIYHVFHITDLSKSLQYIETASLAPVSASGDLVIGPPLKGGPWVAVYDASWQRGHRRAQYTVNGSVNIPGRFAIDFIRLDENGKYAKDSEDDINNWYGYNAKVFAVADGEVVKVLNDFPQSKYISQHPETPAGKATGCFVVLKINEKQFVFYEHLKPGSIPLTVGQRVKKGDIIGAVGFTGQSMGPHLHFHVADSDSPLGSQGIAFEFEKFETIGVFPDFSLFGKEKWSVQERRWMRNNRPESNSVINFDTLP